MTISEAFVTCTNPARLMTRLCRHWSHKFNVELGEDHGSVAFPLGTCAFVAEASVLQVSLNMPEDNQVRMQQVVAEHLQRMAGSETLVVHWQSR